MVTNFFKINQFLNSHLGLDFLYIYEHSKWIILQRLTQLILGLVLLMLFGRYLTKEIFGQYQLFFTFFGMVSITSIPSMNIALARSVALGFSGNYYTSLKKRFFCSFLGIPVFIGLSIYYYQNDAFTFSLVFLLSSFLFPFSHAFNIWEAILTGNSRFDLISKRKIIQNVAHTTILVLTIFFFKNNLILIILINLITSFLFNIYWFSITKETGGIMEDKMSKDIWPYSFFLTKINLLNQIIYHIDKIIVGLLNIELLAVFVLAYKPIELIKDLIKNVYNIAFPKFIQKDVNNFHFKMLFIILISSIFFTFLLTQSAAYIITLFYGDNHTDTLNIFYKLAWLIPFFCLNLLFGIKALANQENTILFRIKFHAPILELFFSIIIFLGTRDLELFLLAKLFSGMLTKLIIYLYGNMASNRIVN